MRPLYAWPGDYTKGTQTALGLIQHPIVVILVWAFSDEAKGTCGRGAVGLGEICGVEVVVLHGLRQETIHR